MSDDGVVLVGVDASGNSDAALRYGAREAHRLDVALRLLHVVPDYVAMLAAHERALPLPPAQSRGAGVTLLTRRCSRCATPCPPTRSPRRW